MPMLPDPIVEHIRSVVEREYEYSDERIHATELCGCLLKAWLRRRYPVEREFERMWYLYRGLIFDELWTSLFPRKQVRVTHRIKNGPTIVGKIDFIYNGKIYELKTVNSVRRLDELYDHHVKQVRFYAWCECVEEAVLLYISFDGYCAFTVDCSEEKVLPVVEEFERKAVELYEALKKNEPPRPDASKWECQFCEYYLSYCGGRDVGLLKNLQK